MKKWFAGVVALAIPVLVACSDSSVGSAIRQPPATTSSTSAAGTPKDELVATFRGGADLTTKSFTVRHGWELRYEITGGGLTVKLVDSTGGDVAQLVKQQTAGGGSIYPSQTGTYSLKITTTGKYLISVFNH